MTTIRAGGEEVTFPKSSIEPKSELSGAFSQLDGRAEDPSLVLEKGINHPHSKWGEIEVDGRSVDDYMKDVASRAAFDWFLDGPEDWNEELYVKVVDAIYGRLVTSMDKVEPKDVRAIKVHRDAQIQKPIEEFILTKCGECGSEASFISEDGPRYHRVPEDVKEAYETRKSNYDIPVRTFLYNCGDCGSYLFETSSADGPRR